MGDEPAMVQRDFTSAGTSDDIELDGEGLAVSLQGGGAEHDVRGPLAGVCALQVRRRVALDAELSDVVFGGDLVGDGGQQGHLHGVGAGDHEGAVEEEEGDGVV